MKNGNVSPINVEEGSYLCGDVMKRRVTRVMSQDKRGNEDNIIVEEVLSQFCRRRVIGVSLHKRTRRVRSIKLVTENEYWE